MARKDKNQLGLFSEADAQDLEKLANSPEYRFPFGKHKGRLVEQVALTDYQYVVWSYNNLEKLSGDFREHMENVMHKLNNFEPTIKCFGPSCEETARMISTVYDIYINPETREEGVSYLVESSYFYCSNCLKSIVYDKVVLNPIKFDTIINFRGINGYRVPFYVEREMHKLLRKTIGFEGRVIEKRAKEFLDRLSLA